MSSLGSFLSAHLLSSSLIPSSLNSFNIFDIAGGKPNTAIRAIIASPSFKLPWAWNQISHPKSYNREMPLLLLHKDALKNIKAWEKLGGVLTHPPKRADGSERLEARFWLVSTRPARERNEPYPSSRRFGATTRPSVSSSASSSAPLHPNREAGTRSRTCVSSRARSLDERRSSRSFPFSLFRSSGRKTSSFRRRLPTSPFPLATSRLSRTRRIPTEFSRALVDFRYKDLQIPKAPEYVSFAEPLGQVNFSASDKIRLVHSLAGTFETKEYIEKAGGECLRVRRAPKPMATDFLLARDSSRSPKRFRASRRKRRTAVKVPGGSGMQRVAVVWSSRRSGSQISSSAASTQSSHSATLGVDFLNASWRACQGIDPRDKLTKVDRPSEDDFHRSGPLSSGSRTWRTSPTS